MVAGPWDNVQLPGPPNGPAWAQAAAQLMGATQNSINSGFNAYNQQQLFGQQQRQANFFQDPQNKQLLNNFIQNPTQQNYAALIPAMAAAGGLQSASPLIDQYLGISQDANIAKAINGSGGQPQQPVSSGPATSTHAASPENITGLNTTPRIGYGEGPSFNDIVAKSGANVPDQVAQNIVRSVGASSSEDALTEDQAGRATVRLTQYLKRNGSDNGGVQGGASPDRGGGNPVAQAATGNQETPQGLGGSGATSPRPTSGSGGFNPSSGAATPNVPAPGSPNQRVAQSFNEAYGNQPDRASPLGDQAKVDAMNARIQQLRALAAASARRSPAAAQQADKRADDIVKERDKLLESISKYNEPGRVTRDLESGALAGQNILERYGKKYDNIQHSADQARLMVANNSVTRSVMDNPNFYSGSGAEWVTEMKRLAVSMGLAPGDYAQANEVFGKTVSSGILDQIRSLGGQGLGQVRVAEINVMKQAAQNHDNTPASNRLLTEINDRMAKRWTIPISEAAQNYKNGQLDPGFDRWQSKWINEHPLFSKDELNDIRLIAPPLARTPADLSRLGLREGEPFRTGRTLKNGEPEIFTHWPKGFTPAQQPTVPSYNPNGA